MSVREFSTLQQQFTNGFNHQFSEEQLQNCRTSSSYPHCGNELRRNEIEKNLQQKTNFEWGKQISDFGSDMGGWLLGGSAFKECLRQEIPSCQLQNLNQHEISDSRALHEVSSSVASSFSPIPRITAGFGVSFGFSNLNSSYPGFEYTMASTAACSTDRVSNIESSLRFLEPQNDIHGVVSTLVACDVKNMFSSVDRKKISGEVAPSPEQILSITACSDGDCHSDKEHLEGGQAFSFSSLQGSESTSGNYILQQHINQDESNLMKYRELVENNLNVYHTNTSSLLGKKSKLDKYNAWIPEQVPLRTPEDANDLSDMIVSKPESSHEELFQFEVPMRELKQSHQQPYPPFAHFDKSSETLTNGCAVEFKECYTQTAGKRPMILPQLLVDRSCTDQREFWDVQPAKPIDSILSLHNILVSYITYKSTPVNAESRQDFVEYMHLTVCSDQRCACDKYRVLISHFDTCHYTGCSICGPVHELGPVDKIYSGSGKGKRDLLRDLHSIDSDSIDSYIIEDLQPSPKRLRMENVVASDGRPMGAVALPLKQPCATKRYPQRFGIPVHNNEDAMEVNKELLSFREDTIQTGVTRNYIADSNGGCANGSFRRTEGHLKLGQPSEAPIYDKDSAEMNKEVFRSPVNFRMRGNDAPDNKMLDNDYASSLPEELIMACKQREMDFASTGNVNSVVINPQSLDSESLPALSEEQIIGREGEEIKLMSKAGHVRLGVKCDSDESAVHYQPGIELKDSKGLGVSLTDFFTEEQIKEHLHSFNQCISQNVMKGFTENTDAHSLGENTCQLCAVDRLVFTPSPIYCSSCGARIKRKLNYYWTEDEMGAGYCFCALCFRESRGGNISFRGMSFSKEKLHKDNNDEEVEEPWVQCDKCQLWQHEICALYNAKRDLEGKGKYICPLCRLAEIAAKEHVSTPAAFRAIDLPRTMLSDHIEERLFRSLKREREERAKLAEKSPIEVPEATDLVVRVVLAVNKQLKVSQKFLDILQGETYPTEFPYRSKVILLFQKIEGVDVCIFGMYVQEFGSECRQPNQRCIYISYLDSVKYFRPKIETVTGEALRTFVYQEILIGYLDYCKQRGFTTCYIWACPPLKGEDYILYCHPEGQKTPKTDKLRKWYKKMLRKALEENVVVDYTNFYDHFFVRSGKCNIKITAACLPYFDGDYWSGAAEDVIRSIEKESGGFGRKVKAVTKRTFKAMGHSDLSSDATKDILVMQKLGQTILPKKEDFIIVRLQFTCINCHEVILSGSRWSCKQCNNFHLCTRCLEMKQNSDIIKTHSIINGGKHLLCQIAVTDVAADTEDKDVIIDNNFFEQRHSFLSFCQANHYQFGTLRRAKHSSMMILYHLNKMTELTKRISCSICQNDITVQWHCKICPEFDVCAACHQRDGDSCHVHELIQHLSNADCETKIKQTQHRKVLEKRELLNLLVHANWCRGTRDNPCSHPNCRKVKIFFLHSRNCEVRLSGGCKHCKRIWFLLCLHSRNCRESNCSMPRCMELKKYREMRAAV
ncbi:histone acetyltransferase HAC12-like [Forsythia ovata]|uniref:histone acetyltransferase n=1 Tax=Forsythia ovata TaxID=205694 RepID=A0ABD1UD78_9LAMI